MSVMLSPMTWAWSPRSQTDVAVMQRGRDRRARRGGRYLPRAAAPLYQAPARRGAEAGTSGAHRATGPALDPTVSRPPGTALGSKNLSMHIAPRAGCFGKPPAKPRAQGGRRRQLRPLSAARRSASSARAGPARRHSDAACCACCEPTGGSIQLSRSRGSQRCRSGGPAGAGARPFWRDVPA